jgi:hypothetical protein
LGTPHFIYLIGAGSGEISSSRCFSQLYFSGKLIKLERMPQTEPTKAKNYQDDWGTGAREGYEDRGVAYGVKRERRPEPGSPLLRTLGGICIVGGLCWAAYLYTQSTDFSAALQANHGPVAILGLGVVASLLGKFIRG